MWYDVGQTLTYNCLFNFVVGGRGCGKSYALKKRAVKQFLEKGLQFVYLRRYVDELDETAESYFNDIINDSVFPDVVIEYKGGCYYINDQIAGYAMALTKAKNYKSISYPMVYLIIFEEFLIEEDGYARYLKNEVKRFLNFYMSIDRYRGCTVFFLANSEELYNPYFLYFNLQIPYGSNILRRKDILIQMVEDAEFIENRENSRFGQIIAGTEFAEYAIKNKFSDNNKTFIGRKTEKARYYFTFVYNGENYGVWEDYDVGKMFLSQNVNPSCHVCYALTVDDHSPNTLLISSISQSPFFKRFIDAYKKGAVMFESTKIKSVAFDVIRLCGVR